MANVRKPKLHSTNTNVGGRRANVAPEGFDYDDDVTPSAIERLRAEAHDTMSKGKWTVIDGYVGDDEPEPKLG